MPDLDLLLIGIDDQPKMQRSGEAGCSRAIPRRQIRLLIWLNKARRHAPGNHFLEDVGMAKMVRLFRPLRSSLQRALSISGASTNHRNLVNLLPANGSAFPGSATPAAPRIGGRPLLLSARRSRRRYRHRTSALRRPDRLALACHWGWKASRHLWLWRGRVYHRAGGPLAGPSGQSSGRGPSAMYWSNPVSRTVFPPLSGTRLATSDRPPLKRHLRDST